MKILVLNCGSSSLKFQLIDMETEERIVKGNFERIGGMKSTLKLNIRGEKQEVVRIARDYDEAIAYVLEVLQNPENNLIKSLDEINGVGHRIVSGGDRYSESILITDKVGLLSSDEYIFAGGAFRTNNTLFFLNDSGISSSWWTLSPGYYDSIQANVGAFIVEANGSITDWPGGDRITTYGGIRPVITINGVHKISGDGTYDNHKHFILRRKTYEKNYCDFAMYCLAFIKLV